MVTNFSNHTDVAADVTVFVVIIYLVMNESDSSVCASNNYRLTEEEDSIPTGPPRTKNELAFDNSHIYDPDAIESGSFNNDSDGTNAPLGFDRDKVNISVVTDELNEIGTIMYVAILLYGESSTISLNCCYPG